MKNKLLFFGLIFIFSISGLLQLNLNIYGDSPKKNDAEYLLKHGDYEKAESLLEKRKSIEDNLLLVKLYLETGQYKNARELLERLISQKKPPLKENQIISALTLYGELLLNIGEYHKAKEVLEKISTYTSAFRARLLLARAYELIGNLREAKNIYYRFVTEYNNGTINDKDGEGLTYVGEACWKLEAWEDANRALREATLADPERVETQLIWARLFLEKYSPAYAEVCLKEALKINPNHPLVHLLLAKVKFVQDYDFVSAYDEIEKALSVNRSLVEAYAFRGSLYARERRWEDALEEIEKGLKINPYDLYTLSVKAGIYFLNNQFNEFEAIKKKIREINPEYVDYIIVLIELLEWEHRYPEIVSLLREGVKLYPQSWKLKTALGLNLLRIGEEEEGITLLKESWDYDPYNVRVYNILNLYEKILPKEYTFVKKNQYRFRVAQKFQKVILPYLYQLVKDGYSFYAKKYGIKPDPVIVELYYDPQHFSVRTIGLPHIGVQGVTFGNLFTAMGPGMLKLNWGEIVLHELSHLFTMILSNYKVPKWFTEGVAVYDTYSQNHYWNYRIGAQFYRFLEEGRLPELSQFNMIFTRARSPDEVALAYYASFKFIEFEVKRYGEGIIKEQLELFAKGVGEREVFEKTTSITIDQLNNQFKEYLLNQLKPVYGENYNLYPQWYIGEKREWEELYNKTKELGIKAKMAISLFAEGDVEAAKTICNEIISSSSKEWRCLHLLLEIAFLEKDKDQFLKLGSKVIRDGFDSYSLRLRLASLSENINEKIEHLKVASKLDPEASEPHILLYFLLLKQKKEKEAILELEQGVELNQHDGEGLMQLVHYYFKQERWDKVKYFGEKGLLVVTLIPELHYYLGVAYIKLGEKSKGVKELKTALVLPNIDNNLKEKIKGILKQQLK